MAPILNKKKKRKKTVQKMAGNSINPVVLEIWPTLLFVCLSV